MDELTGLMNRRVIMGRLDEEFSRARRTGAELGIIMIDIDHFKTVNDTHGHPFGDQVLKQIAARLSNVLRQYDMLGRIGGEEFLIICPATTEHDLNTLAERLRLAVKTGPIGVEQINVSLTISIGITPLRPEDPGPDILLRRSDRALYRAKRKGRDQVVCL
jgi:diguanylate cyclase (GGDEF)-like protein